MKFSKLEGMQVFSSDANVVGEVTGAEIRTKNWEITHLCIELSDEAVVKLGHKKPFIGHITIHLPVSYIKTVGDVVTLDRTLRELKKIPSSK
ncbi:MAG: PRC-barrel domain-containing protein [Thermoplasmatota archaeon]